MTVFDPDDSTEKKAKEDVYYEVDYGELGVQLTSRGIDAIKSLSIRFVGLFETVASYGYVHFNDTADLHLNAIKKPKYDNSSTKMYNTRHVFQLVAQDEHRENFVLTNIKSTGSRGVEKFLPGVHSDIGGGYTDDAVEKNLIIAEPSMWSWQDDKNAEVMRETLIEQGWYKPSELKIDDDDNLLVNRTVCSKKYSYIPLHIMVEYAIKKNVDFDFGSIRRDYDLTEKTTVVLPDGDTYTVSLIEIKERLEKHVYHGASAMRMFSWEDERMLRAIRAKYIHTSAHYNDKVSVKGYPYAPHNPHENYLTRKRETNNG